MIYLLARVFGDYVSQRSRVICQRLLFMFVICFLSLPSKAYNLPYFQKHYNQLCKCLLSQISAKLPLFSMTSPSSLLWRFRVLAGLGDPGSLRKSVQELVSLICCCSNVSFLSSLLKTFQMVSKVHWETQSIQPTSREEREKAACLRILR